MTATTTVDVAAVRSAIVARPWTGVGLALAAGVGLGFLEPRGKLARTTARALGAVILAAVRDAACEHLVARATAWVMRPVAS